MLKILILFTLTLNVVFAKDRFSSDDRKKFLDEVKQEIAEHKVENKGRVDLQIIKPGLYAELEEYLKQEKFTRDEMLKIKQNYEAFSKNPGVSPDRVEEAFYDFIERELDDINKKALAKVAEGNVCNTWSCEDGLKCAPDPVQVAIGKGKKAGDKCAESSECASGECVEEKAGSKVKVCEEVFRCYRPLALGQSCMANPVCGVGICLPYNSQTSGIGECEVQGKSCKKNSDCCSNSCNGGVCKANFICKDCVSTGGKPQRGQKCCEGLYMNGNGVCVPDVPPSVIPQVRVSPIKSIFVAFTNFFISTADAEELEDEEKFLKNGAKNDGLDLKSGIMLDKEKYKNFRAESKQGNELDMDENKAKLVFDKKSNFITCDIRFRDDFYNGLKANGTMDREIAMLAFDFVMSGEADADYWTTNGNAETSIYRRLKKVATAHRLVRADTNKKIENINKKLTCMCIDVQGYNKQTDESKKTFFKENCEEYAKYTDPSTNFDELDGDASGIKAKRLLAVWTSNLSSFYASLTIDNNEAYKALSKVSNWASSGAKWRDTKTRKYELFKFNIKNPSGSVAGLGALIGALLAAGVIAILGGFATTSILSTWMTAGIITASAATGAGGLWMIASLKGAWIQVGPQINDYDIPPRSYSCGKKETCMEYTRTLVQPYNDICKIHASASACLKAFTVISEDKESRYIVDPWIPAGVSRNAILSNQPVYAEKIEEGFQAAKNAMIMKNPGATGGGGKKGGGNFVSELYLSEVFIDANILGSYLPRLGQDLEKTYFMNRDKVKLIKDAAKAFAISEGFLKKTETANLEAFANYAYEYHFLWPKKSNPEEISYPTIGLLDYLRYMAIDIAGMLTTGLAKETISLNKLNAQYLKDYLNNLKLYAEKPINQTDAVKKALLGKEIDKTQKALDNLLTMNALIDNSALDGQLSNLSSTTVAEQSKLAGANGSANFSTDQANFLKAVGNLRASRKEQLKALDTYNKAMASNGDKERTAKMAATSKKFSKSFATGSSAFGSGSSLFASDNSSGSNSDANAAKKDAKNSYGSGSNSAYGTSGTGALFGGGSGSSSSSSSSNNTADSGSGFGSGSSAASSADQDRLADAIDARNKNKDQYQSKDGQSLFEQVTNAYIRNYDKVLIRKKDKDVIEDKR